ncbi:MAG: exonuclease domain-containing protein [Thiobacillus sp.]|jgi:DNA polymerase-3 subunit epsilon|uniref:3'-5' exonuclease family protein n=1 Tax=Thiobacillus sp. TaxID=924 RepID=UPI002893A52F|nr:exonuclease domain-containing protein [Thiobacillus sp.]MDT3707604.1 exonuclease domain-containing protein [Thiobacillus sp.]
MIPARIAFVDLETTGANPAHDRITEIGIVEVDGDKVSRWNTLVNPGCAIPEFIQRLTGISNAMVADAPTFGEVAAELSRRLQGRLFVAHNARFDYGFLRHAFQRLGQRFQADVLCTVRLSRRLFPEHHRHNLDSLIERHGLAANDRHRALADADLIWQFWQTIGREVDAECIDEAVRHQLKRPSLPPHLPPDFLDDVPEAPGAYLFYGEDDALLYVGKGVNLRQRVLSHFATGTREARGLRITEEIRRIDWTETVGELGALLLESRLVKAQQPVHNRQLRRTAEICAWRLEEVVAGDFRLRLVSGEEADPGRDGELYGLFSSRREATLALRKIAAAHELCPVILGLEKTGTERACLAHGAHPCRGACAGKESVGLHSARLMAALARLRLDSWPYPGPIGIVERNEFLDREEVHLVDAWRHLGTVRSESEMEALLQSPGNPQFDLDVYKLLKTQLAKRGQNVRLLKRA